jgi:hopene-associated glycosyltransferase HpnB
MMAFLAFLALAVWLYLILAHGKFWQSAPELPPATPPEFPDVDIIVPARDEAGTIGPVIGSLLAQDYAGNYRVILVDDNSTDGTAALAGKATNLDIISLTSKPPEWSGKLWALSQGVAASQAPVILFTDADILHDPRHLSSLVAKLLQSGAAMVSEMVRLNCTSLAERALVPAFVYFFQMLYPFARVNDPSSSVAAAAGGTVLIRRAALQRSGGIDAIKNALIDDVALAKSVKKSGRIFLGHSALAASIRPYPNFTDIWHMISRTAFTQLRHSAILLILALLGLTLVWLVPPAAALSGRGDVLVCGMSAWALSAISYMPTLARYGLNRLWALALPLIAIFYMAATFGSALNYWRGRGARWKDRAYPSG